MYHVSAQGVDERMINVHYYYYYDSCCCCCCCCCCCVLRAHVKCKRLINTLLHYIALQVTKSQVKIWLSVPHGEEGRDGGGMRGWEWSWGGGGCPGSHALIAQ